jgi:hypothetical protein
MRMVKNGVWGIGNIDDDIFASFHVFMTQVL